MPHHTYTHTHAHTHTHTAPLSSRGDGVAGPGAKKGSELLYLTTHDHNHVIVHDKSKVDVHSFTYPVRATFSTKLRPARFRGKIEFRDVSFCYPTDLRTPVLKGMSFVVEPGQKVALVGPTGCGKSSCMSLIQRLYEPQSGLILIDDVPLEEYDIHYLRSRIVIVDQSTVLFSGTIKGGWVGGWVCDIRMLVKLNAYSLTHTHTHTHHIHTHTHR